MRIIARLLLAVVVVFVLLQFVRRTIPTSPATAELAVQPEVRHILEKDCYSCHSDQRRLSWFDEIVPAYWLVRDDILTARQHLNFSTLGAKPAAVQKATLFEAVNMIQLGAMPLHQYTLLHPGARVTPEELATLKLYLAPWSALPSAESAAETPESESLVSVPPEPNGLPFEAGFEIWGPISITDRGDNNSFRIVLGNGVAVDAAQGGNISPWPDGARFAKIAWAQQLGADGLVHPGKFIQVEFMVKNAATYKDTEGWGWGRWRGTDLKPYGADGNFVNECTGCHQPLRGNDYVYTLPISPADVGRAETLNHAAAALPASLPFHPLDWRIITLFVDPRTHTMAALYGNDGATQAVAAQRSDKAPVPAYSTGAVLALVTWAQREDPHWFGARIPDAPLSIEFVQFDAAGQPPVYRRFAGPGLAEVSADPTAASRTSLIVDLPPAWLP
jgi:hypothetical protein